MECIGGSRTNIVIEDVELTRDNIEDVDVVPKTKMVTNTNQKEQKEGKQL